LGSEGGSVKIFWMAMASSPPADATALDTQAPVWTKRELLALPDVMPGAYTYPMLVHNSELGTVLFTDQSGQVLKFCEDRIHEALDHRLLWIGQRTQDWGDEVDGDWTSTDWRVAIYMYSKPEGHESSPIEAQPSQPDEVLMLADYFCCGGEDPHPGWQRIFRSGEDTEMSSNYVWIGPRPESEADADACENGDDQAHGQQQKRFDQALRIDPGIGRVALTRPVTEALQGLGGCMRLRAWFFDSLSLGPQAHWVGISCRHGSAAVGLAADFGDCYAFINGNSPDGSLKAPNDWQPTAITRTHGWHVFEVLLDRTTLKVFIDGEAAADVPAFGASDEESLWLVARRGAVGHWAGLELIHTPRSMYQDSPWTRGEEERGQWTSISKERGRWQVKEVGGQPVMSGDVEPPESETALEPLPSPTAVEPPPDRPTTASGALTIECWSVPGESEVARFERVVTTFVEQLEASGVTIPDNFQRVGRCGARQDPQPCYIYRFGTRKLHMNLRETEGGRLCLVVRCGGGFLDFAEFARKNGTSEQLRIARMQCQTSTRGRTLIQAASVLSNRKSTLRQMNSSSGFNASRRSQA